MHADEAGPLSPHPNGPGAGSELTMSGKVAVITGGSQGIGAGLVAENRRRGWSVVASARTIIPAEDPDVLTVAGDIADPATADRITRAALARFGRDPAAFDQDWASAAMLERVRRDADSGLATGQVLGAPTLFIGVVHRGGYDPATLLAALGT
jgi:NAD(P)-dependent dehydrogenase (short-subunit alcohol dehydrogenase family)